MGEQEKVPLLPTVGCQLGDVRAEVQPAGNPIELYKAMNNTSRHIGDYEYVIDNPMYKPLVAVSYKQREVLLPYISRIYLGNCRFSVHDM